MPAKNGVAIAGIGDMRSPLVRDALPRRLLVLASVLLSLACNDIFGSEERVVTMDIASQRVACFPPLGNAPCLHVREHPEPEWRFFYGEIEGFQFEPGFEYTIRVAVRDIPNPNPDAPGRVYRLLAVLRKVAA